jgi:hypothetical protein
METVTPTPDVAATPFEVMEHLALPTRVEFINDEDAEEFYNQKRERWMRYAGRILIHPGKAIRIRLTRGATKDDLEMFEHIVERVRQNRYFGWQQQFFPSGNVYWVWTNAWCIVEPGRAGTPLVKCSDRACLRRWHEADYLEHVAYENEVGTVRAVRWDDGADGWQVYVEPPTEEFPAPAAMSLASDLMWAAEECKKLNAGS